MTRPIAFQNTRQGLRVSKIVAAINVTVRYKNKVQVMTSQLMSNESPAEKERTRPLRVLTREMATETNKARSQSTTRIVFFRQTTVFCGFPLEQNKSNFNACSPLDTKSFQDEDVKLYFVVIYI
ncbi:hypothetical protein TNIN_269421 [Trichonephila inaurata madagascariensis]|uniref:Uncharacterized protein n=1 Tax=Trichonephila inaurata madagascariensis TaxID=2747483 RepID=A0A8X6YYE2_9ARAC|nr:hypothetical protein TNIN_269421 [Trichonephila inaurata madagascariensis]